MYECKKCNYITLKKSYWNKHIITKKHKKMAMQSIDFDNNVVNPLKSVVKSKNKTNEKKLSVKIVDIDINSEVVFQDMR